MLHLVLAIFKEFNIIPDKWMFHKALNSFKFYCEITFESVLSNKGKVFLLKETTGAFEGVQNNNWPITSISQNFKVV